MDSFTRLTSRPPATDTVVLAADPTDADRLRTLQAKQAAATSAEDRADLADELEELRAGIVTITFTLESVGATRVDELVDLHPGEATGTYDPKTFGPALIAACARRVEYSDDPAGALTGLTESQVAQLWSSTFTDGDRNELLVTALALNRRGSGLAHLGKG